MEQKENTNTENLLDFINGLVSIKYKTYYHYGDDDVVMWFDDIPNNQYCNSIFNSSNKDTDTWFSIKKKKMPILPKVPSCCRNWVDESQLEQTAERPKLFDVIVIEHIDESGDDVIKQYYEEDWLEAEFEDETETIMLLDSPNVIEQWNDYIEKKWNLWREEYIEWEKTQDIYHKIYSIYNEHKKSSEDFELLISLGQIKWGLSGKNVDRHVITARAKLQFNPVTGNFTLIPDTDMVISLEYDMLDEDKQPLNIQELKEKLEEAQQICDDTVNAVIEAFANSIGGGKCSYENTLKKIVGNYETPKLHYAPAIVFRKRRRLSIQRVIEEVRTGEISNTFAQVVTPLADSNKLHENTSREEPSIYADEQVLLPLPHNDSQKLIISKLKMFDSVLVQGPPGTGKSLTIANIICHLLSQGQRVLVTAQTAKALNVLKDKLPPEIQGLCVSITGDSVDERKEFEKSIKNIQIKYSQHQSNIEQNTLEISRAEKKLDELKEQKAKLTNRIKDVKYSSIAKDYGVDSTAYRGSLTAIVEKINHDSSFYSWFEDDVNKEVLNKVVSSNNLFQSLVQDYNSYKAHLPLLNYQFAINVLIEPELFKQISCDYKHAIEMQENFKSSFSQIPGQNNFSGKEIGDTINALNDFIDNLRCISRVWQLATKAWLLQDFRTGIARPKSLVDIKDKSRYILNLIKIEHYLSENAFKIDCNIQDFKLQQDLKAYIELLNSNGKIKGVFGVRKEFKPFKYIIEKISVFGESCNNVQLATKVLYHLEFSSYMRQLADIWKTRIDTQYSNPKQFIEGINDCLNEIDELLNCIRLGNIAIRELEKFANHIPEPDWTNVKDLQNIVDKLLIEKRLIKTKYAINEYVSFKERLSDLISNRSHSIFNDLFEAVEQCNEKLYLEKFDEYKNLCVQRENASILYNKMVMFKELLPRTYDQFLNSNYLLDEWQQRFVSLHSAIEWGLAKKWITCFQGEDINKLFGSLRKNEEQIKDTVKQIVCAKSWNHCLRRIDAPQSSALSCFVSIGKKIPNSGKTRLRKLREAQDALNRCKGVIPAIIMPLYKVYDTMKFEKNAFDVLIVDEASQCTTESMLVWNLAKKVIVVGDDKQISPESVGVKDDAIVSLIERFLKNCDPNIRAILSDHNSSMYDLAFVGFPGSARVTLTEHFRCVPEIIRFNNQNFYNSEPLLPLRRVSSERLKPIECRYIDSGYSDGSSESLHNKIEASAIVDMIAQCCQDPRYKDKTMGVIALQGHRQDKEIAKLLSDKIDANEIERRRIICGDAYSFQGDERDVIFLSMVVASNHPGKAMTTDFYAKRFNVAVSRAKDQLWLFHSIKSSDISNPGCLRKKLLDYCYNYETHTEAGYKLDVLNNRAKFDERTRDNVPPPFDSWFEVDVFLELANRGYRVIPQYPIDEKELGERRRMIDIVVEGDGGVQLAVECYGDYYHSPGDYDDAKRIADLERVGWEFFIVKEWEYKNDKNKVIDKLIVKLTQMNIHPIGMECSLPSVNNDSIERTIIIDDEFDGQDLESQSEGDHDYEDAAGNNYTVTKFPLFDGVKNKPEWLDPRKEKPHIISEHLIEIVENNGPMLEDYAYKIYLSKTGLQKLGKSLRDILSDAMKRALRTKKVEIVPSRLDKHVIIKAPLQNDAVIRKIHDRDFYMIPYNELELLANQLKACKFIGENGLCRAILEYYGVGRLTCKAENYISEILDMNVR